MGKIFKNHVMFRKYKHLIVMSSLHHIIFKNYREDFKTISSKIGDS